MEAIKAREPGRDIVVEPGAEPLFDLLLLRRLDHIGDVEADLRRQRVGAGLKRADPGATPLQFRRRRDPEERVLVLDQLTHPARALAAGLFARRRFHSFPGRAVPAAVSVEAQPVDLSNIMPLYRHASLLIDAGAQEILVLELAYQHCGPLVDESLGQTRVKRIRKAIFDGTSALLPGHGSEIQSPRCVI